MTENMDNQPTQEDPAEAAAADKLVPVGESIKYRRRAQQAEGRLTQIEQQLTQLQEQLQQRAEELATAEAQRDEARQQLTQMGNQTAVDRLLVQAGVVDLEAAHLLLGKRIDLGDELEPDQIESSVQQLLVDKPFLRGSTPLPPKSASARGSAGSLTARIAQAAQRAVASGDRRDVAEYLRLRRQAAK